jgi:hypothetical protein
MMDYPKTYDEWWKSLNDNWQDISNIISRFAVKTRMQAEEFKTNKDVHLVGILNTAWFNAPDSPRIHGIPGWGVLCDLCSQEHVLHEHVESLKKVNNGGTADKPCGD